MKARCFASLTVLLSLACFAPAQSPTVNTATSAPVNAVVPDGCPVQLAMGRTVSSQTDQPGEQVEFIVKHAVMAGNVVVIPENTYVYGRIVAARMENRQTGEGGMVEFRLESVQLANGQKIPLRNVREVPVEPNADVTPEALTNLVNSPYAPFAHFNYGYVTTIPKNSLFTLYVATDVQIGGRPVVASASYAPSQVDSVASHVTNTNLTAKSLGEIAREQRQRGKISGGMVASQ